MDIRRDALGFFTECSHRYGDIVGMRLGTWPAILLNNPHYAGMRAAKLSITHIFRRGEDGLRGRD
jgi:hypothetical protein